MAMLNSTNATRNQHYAPPLRERRRAATAERIMRATGGMCAYIDLDKLAADGTEEYEAQCSLAKQAWRTLYKAPGFAVFGFPARSNQRRPPGLFTHHAL
jgi:hypothetical protein